MVWGVVVAVKAEVEVEVEVVGFWTRRRGGRVLARDFGRFEGAMFCY